MASENRNEGSSGQSYVVRVYRHQTDPGGFLGVVESAEDGTLRTFASREELWAAVMSDDGFNDDNDFLEDGSST